MKGKEKRDERIKPRPAKKQEKEDCTADRQKLGGENSRKVPRKASEQGFVTHSVLVGGLKLGKGVLGK